MKKFLSAVILFSSLLLNTNNLHAKDFTLKLKSGDVAINSINQDLTLQQIKRNISDQYLIIQFSKIPTQSEKQILASNGIQLLEYLPSYAFIAQLTNPSSEVVKNLNIRGIIPFQNNFKLSKAIAKEENPEWAVNGNFIDLMVESQLNISKPVFRQQLIDNGYQILTELPTGDYFEIRINRNALATLINTPMVKSIDYIPAPPEKEDQRGRSLHRANMLDSDHPLGRKYDGTGVSIAIADDAVIGPHIDTKGRVTSFANSQNGSHGDMTTGIAMGAGNLNPDYRGMATGAYLYYYDISGYPHISSAVSNLNARGVVITSTSFSEGCNAGYTSTTRNVDQQTRQNPSLLHVFSAGNSSASTCGGNAYGAGTPWGTITGGRKQGKSTIATGNLTYIATLTASSSRGPAADGRIKPDICANGTNQMSTEANNTYQVGGGTSAAAPGIAGLAAQMYHGYRALNGGSNPESALIKSAMLNTARDLGNPGPDFTYGWGRVNAHRAMKLIEENRYLDSNILQGGSNTHSVSVPSNLEELKFMIYWTDYEASTIAAKALVNNIDFKVITPTGDTVLPWVLDPTPNATNLNRNAVRGSDDLNNMEQVSIDIITPGTYTLIVDGTTIPQGPQKYFIVWETKNDDIEVTYPSGGESFTPGTIETLRWDAVGNTGSTILDYSLDSGLTWVAISVTNGTARSRDWFVPNAISGDVLIRVRKGTRTGISQHSFSIVNVPGNIRETFNCNDSIGITWNAVAGATAYEVFLLGATHMDSVGTTTSNTFTLQNIVLTDDNWVSVRAIAPKITGKRANAVLLSKDLFLCFNVDAAVTDVTVPTSGSVSDILNCENTKTGINATILNNGRDTLRNFPIQLRYGNSLIMDTVTGPIVSNTVYVHNFKDSINLTGFSNVSLTARTIHPMEQNTVNDSTTRTYEVSNTLESLPYSENFETFSLCPTTFNCGATVCNLSNGWLNSKSDGHDLRTNSGTTPSTGTGPSLDHNPGTSNGKYLYSEASNGCTMENSIVISPCFDLRNTISPEFNFWYHMNGTNVGSMRVDVFSNGSWNLNVIPPFGGNQGNIWRQQTIDMSSYTGEVVNIRFQVTTGNGFASDIAIDDISFIDQATSITEFDVSSGFSVYPNPSEGVFTIQFKEIPKNNIQIMDMNGRIIEELNVKSPTSTVDLSQYAKGIYFLTVKDSGIREKLIVY